MKVKQIGSNMTVITDNNNNELLYSYSTPVAGFYAGIGYFYTTYKYSATTTRHVNKYLGDAKAYAKALPDSDVKAIEVLITF